jgi:hypothetical protein
MELLIDFVTALAIVLLGVYALLFIGTVLASLIVGLVYYLAYIVNLIKTLFGGRDKTDG